MLLEQITGQVERFTVTFVNTYLEKKVCDLFEKNLKHGEHLNVFIRVAGLGASCTFFFFFYNLNIALLTVSFKIGHS